MTVKFLISDKEYKQTNNEKTHIENCAQCREVYEEFMTMKSLISENMPETEYGL
ncbi:MAG: hypothetical protein AB7T10_08315 [bacterium]